MAGLRQLAAFDAVATELHFGRAAERLGVSQAAVSQLVRRLEAEHRVVLFERSSHHVTLTAAGRELVSLAREALAAGRAFDEAAHAASVGDLGVLRVATSDATARTLALLLRRFADEHPTVSVELSALNSGQKTTELLEGGVDVAFTRGPVAGRGLRIEPLWTEPLVAVVPTALVATSDGGTADPAALSGLPLLLIARAANPAMHDELLGRCRTAGVEPTLGTPLAGPREGMAVIAAGLGWTVAPASNAPHEIEGVGILAFADPSPMTTVSLMWRATGASQQAVAFAASALRAARADQLPA